MAGLFVRRSHFHAMGKKVSTFFFFLPPLLSPITTNEALSHSPNLFDSMYSSAYISIYLSIYLSISIDTRPASGKVTFLSSQPGKHFISLGIPHTFVMQKTVLTSKDGYSVL